MSLSLRVHCRVPGQLLGKRFYNNKPQQPTAKSSRVATSFGGVQIPDATSINVQRQSKSQNDRPRPRVNTTRGPRSPRYPSKDQPSGSSDGTTISSKWRSLLGPGRKDFSSPPSSGGQSETSRRPPRPKKRSSVAKSSGKRQPEDGRMSGKDEEEQLDIMEAGGAEIANLDHELYNAGIEGIIKPYEENNWPEYDILGPDIPSPAYVQRRPVDPPNSRIPQLAQAIQARTGAPSKHVRGWVEGRLGGEYDYFQPYDTNDFTKPPNKIDDPLRHASLFASRDPEVHGRLLHTVQKMVDQVQRK